jgi:hypothetical protein
MGLALAYRAKQTDGGLGVGVLGLEAAEHGNNGRESEKERKAIELRVMKAALLKLYTLGPKSFKMRIKTKRAKIVFVGR